MIWALLAVFLLICLGGSSDQAFNPWVLKGAKSQFKSVIRDKERRRQAMDVFQEMIVDAKGFIKDLKRTEKEIRKLAEDYGSTRAEFERIFADVQAKREAAAGKIIERIPELKKNISREEWTKAFADHDAKSRKASQGS